MMRMNMIFAVLVMRMTSAQLLGDVYRPSEDITIPALIDVDVKLIEQLVDEGNFSGAKHYYVNGQGSSTTEYEILQEFSTTLKSRADVLNTYNLLMEYPQFSEYYGSDLYADNFVMAALDGTGQFAGVPDSARAELAVKGIQYQVVFMFVLREFYEAAKYCIQGTGPKVGEWDEGVAFFFGSLASTTNVGYMLYALGEKRKSKFGINANDMIVHAINEGQEMVEKNLCSDIVVELFEARKGMQIALLQGILEYGTKSDTKFFSSPSHATRAELWAFTAPLLPFFHGVNSEKAATVRSNTEYNTATAASASTTDAEQLAATVYDIIPYMCISCEELGILDISGTQLATQCKTNIDVLEASCEALKLEADLTAKRGPMSAGAITGLVICSVLIVVIVAGIAIFLVKVKPTVVPTAATQPEPESDPTTLAAKDLEESNPVAEVLAEP